MELNQQEAGTAYIDNPMQMRQVMTEKDIIKQQISCCPELEKDNACDVLDFRYRTRHLTTVSFANRPVQVEVIVHARFERCPGPMVLGDLVYTNTLLPGEKVSLFTSDRRTRFTYDSQSKVSYRNEQTSEERFFMASVNDFMSDVSVRDQGSASSQSSGSAKGHGGTSGAIQSFFGGASVDVSGSYEASSTQSFLRELSQHVATSDRRAEVATRAASSVSVGEVSSRTHTETESQDHFESSSRQFSNPNHCHAITFFFYQINKTQKIKLKLVAIERRVIDPAADTKVSNNPFANDGDIEAIPNGVLATDLNRVQVESVGRASVASRARVNLTAGNNFATAALTLRQAEPIPEALKVEALKQTEENLRKVGLIDKQGLPTEQTRIEFEYERTSSLPTPGLIVKGCLDDCDICEPEVERAIHLELDNKRLQNELLKRQIELLDKAQEYRCCPHEEETADA
jgi:hypothetical protein